MVTLLLNSCFCSLGNCTKLQSFSCSYWCPFRYTGITFYDVKSNRQFFNSLIFNTLHFRNKLDQEYGPQWNPWSSVCWLYTWSAVSSEEGLPQLTNQMEVEENQLIHKTYIPKAWKWFVSSLIHFIKHNEKPVPYNQSMR